ncbi:HNH endonuclease [Candidatus Saccharibacteria bacterium]|nr:HNH endonuclease [Candidatus Saccharibacteria bacterium]
MKFNVRRLIAVAAALVGVVTWLVINPESYETFFEVNENDGAEIVLNDNLDNGPLVSEVLEKLQVKGRAPKTGYSRDEFYSGWPTVDGCNLRQRILKREFGETAKLDGCTVLAGEYTEPYTGEYMVFENKTQVSKIQIDHVVALSDAWQKGAQYMDEETRKKIATDPLNLLAVDGAANEKKSDGDAATWLPANKKFRCQYVARQVSVKYKYDLWVTQAEKDAIERVLESCPNERTVGIQDLWYNEDDREEAK